MQLNKPNKKLGFFMLTSIQCSRVSSPDDGVAGEQSGWLVSVFSRRRNFSGAGLRSLCAIFSLSLVLFSPHGNAQAVWRSGFENGFPGEWLNWSNGLSQDGHIPDGEVDAWAILREDNGVHAPSGEYMYKGWIRGASSEVHRAYPVIHANIETPLVNTFLVYLDADFSRLEPPAWIHLGTWGNAERWALHTLTVTDGILGFAHTEPFTGEYIGRRPQRHFPIGQWVRITVYRHYEGTTGFIQAWQDGRAILRAAVPALEKAPGTQLQRAHWGMYSNGGVSDAVQYNDDIAICTLPEPLTDLVREPFCR